MQACIRLCCTAGSESWDSSVPTYYSQGELRFTPAFQEGIPGPRWGIVYMRTPLLLVGVSRTLLDARCGLPHHKLWESAPWLHSLFACKRATAVPYSRCRALCLCYTWRMLTKTLFPYKNTNCWTPLSMSPSYNPPGSSDWPVHAL